LDLPQTYLLEITDIQIFLTPTSDPFEGNQQIYIFLTLPSDPFEEITDISIFLTPGSDPFESNKRHINPPQTSLRPI